MAGHANVQLIRRVYQALTDGDYTTVLAEVFSPNVVWHLPGAGPLSGDHHGRDAVLAAMRGFEALSEGTIRIEVHDILADNDHAVALLRARAARGGNRYDSLEIDIYHVADDKVTEFWSFSKDQRVTDEFWS